MPDKQVLNLSRAIALTETGAGTGKPDYTATGPSGEKGAYQWMPGNFQAAAKKYGLDPNDFSPANQDKVAYRQVLDYKTQGYDPGQIGALWNSGSADNWQNHKGVNGEGVPYDTPAYVASLKDNYTKISGGTPSTQGQASAPGQVPPPTPDTSTTDTNPDPGTPDPQGGGIMSDVLGGAASVGKSILQGVVQPLLRPISNIRSAIDIGQNLNDPAKQAQIIRDAATKGYDYGILGNATSFGDNPDRSIPQNIAESIGVGIDVGSFLLPLKEGEVAVQGAKDIAGKLAEKVAANPKKTFATAQAVSTVAQGKAKGESNTQAAEEGVGAGLGSLAFLGILGKTGQALGSFGKTISQTKAGQILSQRLNDAMDTLKHAVTPETIKSNVNLFKSGVNAAAQKVGVAVNGMFDGLLRGTQPVLKPYPKTAVMDTITDKFKNANVLRFPIGQDFAKVFASGVSIAKNDAQGLIKTMEDVSGRAIGAGRSLEDLATQITDARARGAPPAQIQDLTKQLLSAQKEQSDHTGNSIAGGLRDYLDQVSKMVMQPLQQGKNVPIDVLAQFIHYIKPGGTPTEEALGNQIQDALYKAFEDKMGKTDPAMLDLWKGAKESARQLGNSLDSKFATLLQGTNTMQQMAEKFITGNFLSTPQDTKEMISLLGNQSVQDLREGIVRRLFENSQAAYKAALGIGRPENLQTAGKAAAKVFDDFIAKAEKASDNTVQFLTPDQIHFLNDARDTIGGDLSSFAQNAKIPMAEQIQNLYQTVQKGMPLYDSNPSTFAAKLSKMELEDIQAAKALYSPKQWSDVGATILKDIAEKSKSIFAKNFDEKSVTSFVKSLGTMGGPNREAIFKEIFGDTPEVGKGVEDLIKMTESIKGLEQGSASYTKAVAHGVASFIFAITHHPIMAFGQASKGITELSNKSAKTIEKELYSQLEKEGKVQNSTFKSVINWLGKMVESKIPMYEAGRAGAQQGTNAVDLVSSTGDQ